MNLAAWLLDRFGVADSVTGDIIERSASGKSRLWLGRQVADAIVGAVIADARRHPWLALRGVIVGLALVSAISFIQRGTQRPFDEWLGRGIYDYVHLNRSSMILLVTLANALLVAPCWFAIGWLVARWHHPYLVLAVFAVVLADVVPRDVRQIADAFRYPMSVTYRAIDFASMAIWLTTFTLALTGGALRVGTRRHDIA